MENVSLIIILLSIVTALAQITDRIRIPYPILLVLVGIGIGLVPGLPHIELHPDVVFLIFMPPVLFAAAWYTSWPDFKKDIKPISQLAIGCVLFSTIMVAAAAHYFIPGFGWPESFVLGAIISPPDAVAATAATKGLKLPKRIITILEGESLVNDATGLIAYRYAVAVTVSGSFIFWLAGINFFYVAFLGIGLGIVIGYVFFWIHKITPDNATTDTTFTLLAPYASYLVAEYFQASGVLAVVATGLFMSPRASEVFSNRTRIQATAVWDTIIFILNGVIFIVIGLQLPVIMEKLDAYPLQTLLWYGTMISVVAIIARILWVYPEAYIPRWLGRKGVDVSHTPIIAWSGMRGIVSLAAALALPIVMSNNQVFPNRDLIIFLTFCAIFATLVLQGLTFRKLVKWVNLNDDGEQAKAEEKVRLKIATVAIENIEEEYSLGLSEAVLAQVKSKYEIRIQRLRKDQTAQTLSAHEIEEFIRIQLAVISQERAFIIRMRKLGDISDEVLRKIEYELDLEQARLELEQSRI